MRQRLTAGHAKLALCLAVLALAAMPAGLAAKPRLGPVPPQTIEVNAAPLIFDREDPERRRFGALTWLGGVRLTSPSPRFGGWSGLVLDAQGAKLLAVSDAGLWLTGTLAYDADRITGLAGARIGSLLGRRGKPFLAIKDSDAEALSTVDPEDLRHGVYIGFERNHRIGIFPVQADGIGPARDFLKLPRGARQARPNAGIEALAVLRAGRLKGTLVAFTESLTDAKGNHRGWLIGGPSPGPVTLRRMLDFAITDLAALPDGGLLVLERHFSWATGVRMRLRRIKADTIRPGALLDGEVLMEAGPTLQIDNMEAMAVHRAPGGGTVVTLLSDDNYSPLQRTLLLQFRLEAPVP